MAGEKEVEERQGERRHREKKERDPSRPHKSRSSRPKIIDPETGEVVRSPHRRKKEKSLDEDRKMGSEPSSSTSNLVPELSRTASTPGATSRTSIPYPSFNKAYSKEAVSSRDDVRLPEKKQTNPYTPDPTDLGADEKQKSRSTEHVARGQTEAKHSRPPSPPETDVSQQRKVTPPRMAMVQEDEEGDTRPNSRTSLRSRGSTSRREKDSKSKLSINSKQSKASTAIKSPRMPGNPFTDSKEVLDSVLTSGLDSRLDSGVDSNVTSVAPDPGQKVDATGRRPPSMDGESSPDSALDSSPPTPTQTPGFAPPSVKPSPSPFTHFVSPDAVSSAYDSPLPPPPPPPPNVPVNIPCVDYLLQNGGLLRPAPKTLISPTPTFAPNQSGSRQPTPLPSEIERIFGPFYGILDQYETVINKNGSLAVATGYRSVARRLLDRLEVVMARDLSSEGCLCVMCQNVDLSIHEGSRGLGWGEVLEWVAGRQELPVWPAFDFAMLGVRSGDDMVGLGNAQQDPMRPGSPVKIDPDVADEFREHYLQQSKKTKLAVNKWLSSCPQTAATPPQEVDDETLSFAILTHLGQDDRSIFNALISGTHNLQPVSRAPTPMRKPRSDFMMKTGHSIQRLYKLPIPPRDPEVAIFLLKHPKIHNLLATMSGISPQEWEILTSGRFDGFLWSGAQMDSVAPSPAPSRGPTPANGIPYRGPMSPGARQPGGSRTTTPFSPLRNQTFSPAGFASRGPTPFAPARQPVSNDEETEIAVLAEVEREIYQSMEVLEDAFEGLHRKAELVRRALRERGAGLSMSLQSRQLAPDIMSSTPQPQSGLGMGYERVGPSWGPGDGSEVQSESDWDANDEVSELAPDDSASNISSSRHRRPKRRNERRTPALVEEEDED